MSGLLLDRKVAVWRKSPSVDGGLEDTQVYSSLDCAIEPISSLDTSIPFGYESTHIVWVPYWVALRKEDQIRYGRQPPNPEGDVQPWIFVINGRRDFRLGIAQLTYYAREID